MVKFEGLAPLATLWEVGENVILEPDVLTV
jgi:hypothetical protein